MVSFFFLHYISFKAVSGRKSNKEPSISTAHTKIGENGSNMIFHPNFFSIQHRQKTDHQNASSVYSSL